MGFRGYRRAAALLQALIIIAVPFIKIRGESALRFDVVNLKLHFFGSVIWIKELYLVLAAVIFIILILIAVTTILGRIWCGWTCPQTVLLDISDDIASVFPVLPGNIARHIVLIPLSALVSLTLIWYFVPPADTMSSLFRSRIITGFFIVQWGVIYAELTYLGRTFCTTICPYSMLQNGLFDSETLVISYDHSRSDECMGCDKCVRVCPAGIDIKDGTNRKCIACAECVDACRSMTGRIPSLIEYSGKIKRKKTALFASITLIAALALTSVILMRPPLDIVVSRDNISTVDRTNIYSAVMHNNTKDIIDLSVRLKGNFRILGNSMVRLEPFSMSTKKIAVKATGPGDSVHFIFEADGIVLERKAGFL
ncbi:MAG: 4Fe-4S binding protein [Nitrospirota bacterium]|nr:MAG: 4Fe-4S binding protein [Nitrospirota bacterium]